MSLNNINKRNKNNSSINSNSNSSRKNNFKKVSPNTEKNTHDFNTNKKSVSQPNYQMNSNSKNLTVKKNNKNNNSKLKNTNIINIDNIDISLYNPDPFILPKKEFEHNLYITKIEETIYNYNNIKVALNKKIFDNKIPKKALSLQLKNFALLEELDKLNIILDILVERKRFSCKKDNLDDNESKSNDLKNKENIENNGSKKLSLKHINNKLLDSVMKQNKILTEKYQKLTKINYISDIKKHIDSISLEIIKVENKNRDLKKAKIMHEYELNKKKVPKNDINYKNKVEQYEHFDKEYSKLMKYIATLEDSIKVNDQKIGELNDTKNKLIKKAKEEFNIENPEVKIVRKTEINKNEEKKRELEKENKTLINKIKKFTYQEKDNDKTIKYLKDEIKSSDSLLKERKEMLILLNDRFNQLEQEYFGLNNNNNNNSKELAHQNNKNINYINDKINQNKKGNKNDTNNKQNSFEIQTLVSPIKLLDENNSEINDNKIVNILNDIQDNKKKISLNKNIKSKNKSQILENNSTNDSLQLNNRYNNGVAKNLNNNKTYNKKMILEQLDMQNNKENQVKLDKSISLKKNKLKPNFSFSLNDMNLKDKKVNLSVALLPKSTINEEKNNEIEGEIKEDIEINNNINEEKNNLDNKDENQKIFTNLSQNISMENNENEEGKIRENDLNTFPYNEIDNEEKHINSYDNEEINLNDNYINSNEQEHVFENDQINIEDNINMD